MVMLFCMFECLLPTMSLDIMFLTNDNLNRLRKEPPVLGLRYRGLANGIENDQNSTNIPDLSHARLSITSTASNQSYDSGADYAVPKHALRTHDDYKQEYNNYTHKNGQKVTNPLFGVNAASQYNPAALDEKYAIPNGVRKAPEGQDNEAFKEDTVDGRNEVNQIAITDGGTATYTTDNNGKINVHVTVMINAGTLADLKKQRAQIRTNGSPVESSVHSPNTHSLVSIPEDAKEEKPPILSPTTTVPRFSGNTSDVVGDTKSRRCCIIM